MVHGPADLNPLDAASLEGYAETRFIKRAQRSDIAKSCLLAGLARIFERPDKLTLFRRRRCPLWGSCASGWAAGL
jgi:hypothetical protein